MKPTLEPNCHNQEIKVPLMETKHEIIHSMETDYTESRLLTASSDSVIRLFKIEGLSIIPETELKGLPGPVTKAIFLNRGEFLCASFYTGEVLIWKLEGSAYNKKFEKKLFEGSVNAISHLWLDNSFRVFCGCSDGHLRILDFDTRFSVKESKIFCHRFGISSVSSNERYLMTGSMDHTTTIFDIKSMHEIKKNTDHKNVVRDVSVCSVGEFDIFCFASCSDDGTVVVYNKDGSEFKKQVIDIGQPAYSLAWSKTGYSLSVGYGESSIKHFVPDISGSFKEVEMKKAE